MKKTFLTLSILFLLAVNFLNAQELKNYNLYNHNNLLYNPAHYVNNDYLTIYTNTHLQWIGFEGAPRNYDFGANLQFLPNMGAGLTIVNNRTGLLNNLYVNAKYAYQINFSQAHFLKMGLSIGIINNKLFSQEAIYVDLTDVTLQNDYFNKTSFSSGFGLSYNLKNLEAQFIMPQLFEQRTLNVYNLALLSYNFQLSDVWELKPSVLIRNAKATPSQFDVNLMAYWNKMLWSELTYRSNNSFVVAIGLNISNYAIGYAYQANTKPISSTNGGSHEIQLIFRLNNIKPVEITKTKVYGNVLNINDKSPLISKITVYEKDIKIDETFTNDKNGFYEFNLKPNNSYKFKVEANGFTTITELVVTDKNEKLEKNFDLKNDKVIVQGKVINKYNKIGLISEVMILNGTKIIESISTDKTGAYSVILDPQKEYTIKVNAENYAKYNEILQVNQESGTITKDLELNPKMQLIGKVTDAKTGKPLEVNIEIYNNLNDEVAGIFKTDATGLYIINIDNVADITITAIADGYMFYSENMAFDFNSFLIEKNIKLSQVEKGATVVLNNVNFDTGKSILRNEAIPEINRLIGVMKQNSNIVVEISGHTDNTGTEEYNKQLSQDRANSVVNYMVENGISKDRLKAAGYGATQPRATNDTDEGKQLNRRVEAKVISE